MVESLISQNSSWDLDEIRPIIFSAEHLAILETGIGDHQGTNHLVWPWYKRGRFTMHSAQRNCGVTGGVGQPSSSWQIGGASYSVIFNLKPPLPIYGYTLYILRGEHFCGCKYQGPRPPRSSVVLVLCDTTWVPPISPFRKVNVDASWCATTKLRNMGIVIRDHVNGFVVAREGPISAPSVMAREVIVVLGGCNLARDMGLSQIVVELVLRF
ncbi:hypothetical protein ACFXTN_023726 [Malus domestica]